MSLTGLPEQLTQEGKSAFECAAYSDAIRLWERARHDAAGSELLNTLLSSALSEAYFRRGVASNPPVLEDLEHSVALAPDDDRNRYHLGRAFQWQGIWDRAIEVYRGLLSETPPYSRAAFPLAQVLVASGQEVKRDEVWDHLTPSEQTRIDWTLALMERQVPSAGIQSPDSGMETLWLGLSDNQQGFDTAGSHLKSAIEDPDLPLSAQIVARYYLGLLAWKAGDRPEAVEYWESARRDRAPRPRLYQNLLAAYQRLVLDAMAETDSGSFFPAEKSRDQLRSRDLEHWLEQGFSIDRDDQVLLQSGRQFYFQQGYAAAVGGRWLEALKYWELARRTGRPSRELLTNMALAHEAVEHYATAADLWRQVLRRRPRKADSAGALSQQQVARLWQHVAENYRKVGDYEEATKTYRNAVKWDPDNLALRLSLVESLMADGRPGAASTLVIEILGDNPDHVEALAWQARIFEAGRYLEAAAGNWMRVLELEPEYELARQHLAQIHADLGDSQRHWGDLDTAIKTYRRGLDYSPADSSLYASIGLCEALRGKMDAARAAFQQALDHGRDKLEAYYWVIRAWIQAGNWEEAQGYLERALDSGETLFAGFYLDLAGYASHVAQYNWASSLLERAESCDPDAETLVRMANIAQGCGQGDHAIAYLRRSIKMNPDLAEGHLWLGTYYFTELHQRHLARRHLETAKKIARQNGDASIMFQVGMIDDMVEEDRPEPGIDTSGGLELIH